jgi:uncharacterized protein YbjT (DUF2867 family)
MKIAIAGAAGFVGKALTKRLSPQHHVIGLSRSATPPPGLQATEWRACDLFSLLDAEKALQGVETAYYLVHSMLPSARLTQGSFEDFDLIAADNFARAARKMGVKQIIYLGGLLPHHRPLSRHLASRLEVERTLASAGIPVTTLRASLIVGPEGSSFQMLVRLVRRLPMMICPRWTESLTQPIALEDVVELLAYCVEHPERSQGVHDIGGPDVLSYRQMIELTAEALGKRRWLAPFPLFTPGASRLWVSLMTGAPRALVLPLVQSLRHDMVANTREWQLTTGIEGKSFRQSLKDSLADEHGNRPRAYRPAIADPDVRSVQRLTRPAGRDAFWLGEEYMRWLPSLAPWLLNVQVDKEGFCRFYVGKLTLLVLQLSPERSSPERALFYIREGWLTKKVGRGRLEFRLGLDGKTFFAALHEYRPRLPWYVYKWTQALAHLFVMRAFGAHLRKLSHSATLSTSV